jgi:adenosylmethionine---8-amino-7-oxononanoate aminotransferase
MTLLEKDLQYVWHPFTQAQTSPVPLPIVKAEGIWLFDENGKRYMDANSSWWTIIHGHCHPYMIEEVHKQMQTLDHSIFAGSTHPKAVEAAEKVVQNIPGNPSKAFFSDNGSTAVEVGLKMVYQYWYNKGIDKKRFLAIEGAYHGDTFGAMSVGQRGYFNKPFESLFFDVDYLPFPTEDNFQDVIERAKELMGSGEFAGFIFEPLVQGAAGMRIYKAEWLDELIKIAKANKVLTIADEVMTGFYRTGSLFAIGQLQQSVDIVALSKGLTGGVMAMGMTVTTEHIFEAFLDPGIDKAFLHGHSFTANPIACSAVCASMDLLLPMETKMKVESISSQQSNFCQRIKDHPKFRSAKSQGTILSLEIEVGEESSYFSSMKTDAYNYFLSHEILIRPLGNVIYLNPPYCITEEQLAYIHEHILSFVENWEGEV